MHISNPREKKKIKQRLIQSIRYIINKKQHSLYYNILKSELKGREGLILND